MNMAMESMNLCERALYEQEMHKMGAEEFMHHAEHADEYINLIETGTCLNISCRPLFLFLL